MYLRDEIATLKRKCKTRGRIWFFLTLFSSLATGSGVVFAIVFAFMVMLVVRFPYILEIEKLEDIEYPWRRK